MAVDALVFHQKYTRRQWLGILLVLVSMVLLNL
jgi:drug/metabolite transporter (DMT)-like permease